MSKLTVEQVSAEVLARGAEFCVISAEVWTGRHEGNSHVKIYTTTKPYEGKTLEEAFALYMAQFAIGEAPAVRVAEIAAINEEAQK